MCVWYRLTTWIYLDNIGEALCLSLAPTKASKQKVFIADSSTQPINEVVNQNFVIIIQKRKQRWLRANTLWLNYFEVYGLTNSEYKYMKIKMVYMNYLNGKIASSFLGFFVILFSSIAALYFVHYQLGGYDDPIDLHWRLSKKKCLKRFH